MISIIDIYQSTFIIDSSNFNKNTIKQYGCILLDEESNVSIFNTSFIGCISNEKGGAIYSSGSLLDIKYSRFIGNQAQIGGAIYYVPGRTYFDPSNIFEKNNGSIFGKNLYSNPYFLCFFNEKDGSCSTNKDTLKNFRPGAELNLFKIRILDEERNQMIENDLLNLKLYLNVKLITNNRKNNEIYSINASTSIINIELNEDGFFKLNNITLIGIPNSEVTLEFSSPQIQNPLIKNNFISFNVTFRNCEKGEYQEPVTGICYVCPHDTFSFDTNEGYCKKCLEGLKCQGGANTTIEQGYWRSKLYSEKIIKCTQSEQSCVGGVESENKICRKGNIGAKCESCDLTGKYWNSTYTGSIESGCVECENLKYNYIILAFLSLFNFVSMALSIKGTLDNVFLKLKMLVISLFARYGMFNTKENESSMYIKIYISYFQIIQILSMLELKYTDWFDSIKKVIGSPNSSVLYSFDCALANYDSFLSIIHLKIIITLFVPFFYLILFAVCFFIWVRKTKKKWQYGLLYTVGLFTVFFFQPDTIDSLINALTCVTIGDEDYMKYDVAYKCDGDVFKYSLVLGIPFLIFWAAALPLLILWRIYKNRMKLNSIKNRLRYGFFYEDYNIYFWEFVRMYEKIFLTIIVSFFETRIVVKGVLVIILIYIYKYLLEKHNPYKTKTLNSIEKLNTNVCLLSTILGVLAYADDGNITFISYAFIIIINFIFNYRILRKLIIAFTYSYHEKLMEMKKGILLKYPFLKIILKPLPEIKTIEQWRAARRVVSKYLRSRERKKFVRLTGRINGLNDPILELDHNEDEQLYKRESVKKSRKSTKKSIKPIPISKPGENEMVTLKDNTENSLHQK